MATGGGSAGGLAWGEGTAQLRSLSGPVLEAKKRLFGNNGMAMSPGRWSGRGVNLMANVLSGLMLCGKRRTAVLRTGCKGLTFLTLRAVVLYE